MSPCNYYSFRSLKSIALPASYCPMEDPTAESCPLFRTTDARRLNIGFERIEFHLQNSLIRFKPKTTLGLNFGFYNKPFISKVE